MRLPRFGRKTSRTGAPVFRETPEPGSIAILRRGGQVLIVVAAFVVLVAMVTKPPELPRKAIGYDIDSQSVALDEVRSDIYFETEDLQATKLKRDEAAAKVPETYRVDRETVQKQLRLVDEHIQAILAKRDDVEKAVAAALDASNSSQAESEVVSKAVADYALTLKDDSDFKDWADPAAFAVWLTPLSESVPKRQFAPAPKDKPLAAEPVAHLMAPEAGPFTLAYAGELSRLVRDGLEYVLTYGVLSPGKIDPASKENIIIVREEPMADLKVSDEIPLKKTPTPRDALDMLGARIAEAARAVAGKDADRPVDWSRLQAAALAVAKTGLTDTLIYDQVYTEGALERARLAVAPIMKEVQPGEAIQRNGDRWSAQSRSDTRTYWAKLQSQRAPVSRMLANVAANAIFVLLILACQIRSILFLTNRPHEAASHVNLSLLITCATLIVGRITSYFEPSGFVLPLAAGAILLAILINPRIAIISSLMTATLVSIQFGYDWRLLIVSAAMCVAGVFGTYVVRRRSDMTRAALKATAVGVAAMAAVILATDSVADAAALRKICLVLLNGGACLLLVPGLLSPLERLFRITTDIQLLEYSDLNNEVLSRMAIEMPGTYAHSLMLGQIAEAAADAIGANGLLARVLAYYHDIGKMRRPDYFSENQTGLNVHDDMPPRVSARAIAVHVAHGVEVAREFHLPKPIVDGIRQHHGTSLISFFYQQAVEQHRHHDVREEDFRYPGPKPQSRETAILMICDAVESGVRSIKNLNEERVREFVDKIVTGRAADGQFDACSLTLKDLDTIKEVVARRILASLHTRIAYPEPPRADNVISISGGAK